MRRTRRHPMKRVRRRLGRLSRALLALGLVLGAGAAPADRREDLEALRQAIEQSRERVALYEREQRGLLEALEALDRAALLLARDVEHSRQRAGEARRELARISAEADGIQRKLAATERAMEARAVALYRAGELGGVRLLFSAGDVSAFLSRVSALRLLLRHDSELVARHRAQSRALELARVEARASAVRLEEAERLLAERSAEFATERRRKRRLLAGLHADRTQERAALVELEKAASALEETLETLGAEPAASELSLPGPPFLTLRRALEPPVAAPIVRHFGRVVDAELGTETFQSGVVFDVPVGTPVLAVAAGRVRFAGWFRGYGRLVILDHGGGYFSVTGHLDQVEVELGDLVQPRQAFATSGETGSLAGPQLYFEIRRGGEALDPADWLRLPRAG